MLQHEEYDWLTLIACEGYDAVDNRYRHRLVVRAVLMEVDWDRSAAGFTSRECGRPTSREPPQGGGFRPLVATSDSPLG